MALTPTTKLEAINLMLASIGEAPVTSLNSGLVDADMAEDLLDQQSKSIQTKGWGFNTDYDYNLTTDGNNNYILPSSTLKFSVPGYPKYVRRGSKVYDNENRTDVFSGDLKCTLTYALDFDELSEATRQYIYISAARRFQDRLISEPSVYQVSKDDEIRARGDFWNEQATQDQYNVVRSSITVNNARGRFRKVY